MKTGFLITVLLAGSFFSFAIGITYAANVIKSVTTPSGSLVQIFADGTASNVNTMLRWNIVGNWVKKGDKYCVTWISKRPETNCF